MTFSTWIYIGCFILFILALYWGKDDNDHYKKMRKNKTDNDRQKPKTVLIYRPQWNKKKKDDTKSQKKVAS